MQIKEEVVHELESLTEVELQQVAEYVAFLKFQEKMHQRPAIGDAEMARLYAEFSEEDQMLAEEGVTDYAQSLVCEDKQ